MAIVGLTFTKLSAEKKNVAKGKVTIANDVGITKVTEAKVPLTSSKQSALSVQFEYKTKYEPEIGTIDIAGEILWVDEVEKNKKIIEEFKKDKTLPLTIKLTMFNSILTKSAVEALVLSRDVQLPSPIKLPKAKAEEK